MEGTEAKLQTLNNRVLLNEETDSVCCIVYILK